MKFRKKPVVIEAVQFTRDNINEVLEFAGEVICEYGERKKRDNKGYDYYCFINTLEGLMAAKEFDYIIKGVKGEFYPCKCEIFKETYEVLEND